MPLHTTVPKNGALDLDNHSLALNGTVCITAQSNGTHLESNEKMWQKDSEIIASLSLHLNIHLIHKGLLIKNIMWGVAHNLLKANKKGISINPGQEWIKFENMVIKFKKKAKTDMCRGDGRSDFESHLWLWCTFGQDITFCCLVVYISSVELIWRLKM